MPQRTIQETVKINTVGTTAWFAMANYDRVAGFASLPGAEVAESVTVQLRKATDAAGTNAANLGAAVTTTATVANTDLIAVQEAMADDLGKTGGGLQFTHVSITVTKSSDTEVASAGYLLRANGRFGTKSA